ncbi:MAG TPA: hypothetical protein VFZ61_16570 [Polyangiales bacterium]
MQTVALGKRKAARQRIQRGAANRPIRVQRDGHHVPCNPPRIDAPEATSGKTGQRGKSFQLGRVANVSHGDGA